MSRLRPPARPLTNDEDLISRIGPVASLQIQKPSENWTSLDIPASAPLILVFDPLNLLAHVSWWKL